MDLDKDLRVDQGQVLNICLAFRDRYETPTRLADAFDDPMPVNTGNPGLNSDLTVAMQVLAERFDEFGEAMRQDAAGLVRDLQRFRRVEALIAGELDQLARRLTRSPGANRPVLPRPDPGLPPAAQLRAGLRPRNWEAVDPPIGAGCGARLGEPEGIRALARALHQAADGMQGLIADLRRRINELVPGGWRGASADVFKAQIEQQLQTAARGIVERARKLSDAANLYADELHAAWVTFSEAEVIAMTYRLTIEPRPRTDGCEVRSHTTPSPELTVATGRCQSLVDQATANVLRAQSPFRIALAESFEDKLKIVRPLNVPSPGGSAADLLTRQRARARLLYQRVRERVEAELLGAPRTGIGSVGAVPQDLMGPDGRPTAEGLRVLRQRILERLQTDHPGIRFEAGTGPGGADLRVIGRADGVRDPGFDYVQVIYDDPAHLRRFTWEQWGRPGFAGRGQIITFDADGQMRRLSLSTTNF